MSRTDTIDAMLLTMDSSTKELLAGARDHYDRQEFERAEGMLHELLRRGGAFADVYDMLGVIAHSRGEFLEAAQWFERAVDINPNYTEALLNLAVTYNALGRYDAAESAQVRAGGLCAKGQQHIEPFARGKIANMHAGVAQAYAEAGLLDEGIEELRKAIDLCPSFADLRTRLAEMYRERGDLARARDELLAAQQANPRYTQATVLLGLTLFSLGDVDTAIARWHEVLQLEPDNRKVLMYLRMADAHANGRKGNAPRAGT